MPSTRDNSDRSILPPPDPPFRGEINVAFADSKADFPEALRAPEGAPNVLIMVGDDIGYGHMGAFGGPARTPTFDRLAEQGLKYTNFHVTAVCAASRSCLLTGRNGPRPVGATRYMAVDDMLPRSIQVSLSTDPPPPGKRRFS
jgi:arylsulfatase